MADKKKSRPLLVTLYDEVYKSATASGETHRGAHLTALEAVYEQGRASVGAHPLRRAVALKIRDFAARAMQAVDA